MGEPAVEPDPLDIDRLIRITNVACEIGNVAERMRHADRAGRAPGTPAPRAESRAESRTDSLATLASMARASGDTGGARGALESLAATAPGRELDRRAWLSMAGGATALVDRSALDEPDDDARAWIDASAADDAAFLARVAAPAWPFDAVHGERPDEVARDVVVAAADLLCRFGPALGGELDPGAPTRTGTPIERAARRLALDVRASTVGAPDAVPVRSTRPAWVQGIAARVEARLETLTRAERAVAAARLGLDGDAPLTLDETRERLGLDAELAERLEGRAFGKLARVCDDLLPAGRTAVALLTWFHATDGRMHLRSDALEGTGPTGRLPAGLRALAPLLTDPHRPRRAGTAVDCLARSGALTRWKYVGPAGPDGRIGADRAGVPLPNRLDALVPAAGEDELERLAALAGADRRVHLGYAVPAGSSPRHRRVVEALHLLRADDARFVDVATLYERHRATFGPPGCTPRTYARTLAGFPHLVVEGVSRRWAALDDEPPGPVPTPRSADPSTPERRVAPSDGLDDRDDRDGLDGAAARALADRVRELLRAEPVLRAGELAERLGDASRAAVATAVDDDPGLRRFAPGLVARHADLDALVADPPAALLDEAQWRLLSDALRGGERPDDPEPLYPAWRGESLDALVRWGRDAGLRFVDARERLRDEDLAASRARFEPRHLIAMTIACADRPSIGWMRINRLLGARVDSREAVWPVALLAGLGVVALGEHWQHPLATDRARAAELRSALFALARTRAELRWRDEALRGLLGRFDARAGIGTSGATAWLHESRVAGFLDERLAGAGER